MAGLALRRVRLRWCAVALALVTVPCCSDRDGSGPEQIVIADDLEYADGVRLSVHSPVAPGSWPAVVLVHGAGLDRRDYEDFANRMAERGAVVFNADWSVLASSLSIGVEQIACAVRFARGHGPEFGAASQRVVLVAHSTAAASAVSAATGGEAPTGLCDTTASATPDGLALLSSAQLPGGPPWPLSSLGANPELRVAVVHGIDDDVVSPRRSERMAEILAGAGYHVTLDMVPGGHYALVMIELGTSTGPGIGSTPTGDGAETTISIILDLVEATRETD